MLHNCLTLSLYSSDVLTIHGYYWTLKDIFVLGVLKMIRTIVKTLALIVIFQLGATISAAAKQPDSPEAVVAEFQLQLLEVMKVSETLDRKSVV